MSFTGSTLKWIAIVTMLIDHIGAFLIEPYLLSQGVNTVSLFLATDLPTGSSYYLLYQTYVIFRLIGRLSFPIFAFLLVEEFLYTRHLKKYISQLGLFALLSEIPFDLASKGVLLEFSHQNIFFTLFIGLLCIAIFDLFDKKQDSKWIILLLALLISELLKVDYSIIGILSIFIFYYFHDHVLLRTILNGPLFLMNLTAIFSFIPIQLYNGKRGKQNKTFFYLFYPGHLILLFLIRMIFIA
ncbi:TraX family protein [Carnobacterium iners]|uniref:TraX family protein n=1 Tax=Carnobacterium iners TaxID=1073423 RepID=UPI00210AF726|nr:TraX family protein [Carnobacterium iners]